MKIIFTACVYLIISACNQQASTSPSASTDMTVAAAAVKMPDTTTLGGQWFLQPVLASDTAAGKLPTVSFDLAKTHYWGNTGCNTMSGTFWFSDKDSSLSFSDKMVSTKMSCPGYNEEAFVKSLMHANHYRLEKGMLILLTDNTPLSKWTRRPSVLPKTGRA